MTGVSIGGLPCLSPKEIYEFCLQQGLPVDWYGKPNRYSSCIGGQPGVGYLIISRSNYDRLVATIPPPYQVIFQSDIGSTVLRGIILSGYPRMLTPGANDPAFMIEITDQKSNLVKATNQRYTWRVNPSDEDVLNEKTWAEVAEDLWNHCQFSQPWPGLPADTPGGDVICEQLDCHAFMAVNALEDVLQALGCVLAHDPTSDTFSIQYIAKDREFLREFATYYRAALIYDETPYNPVPLFNVPEKVRVVFPVWSEDSDTSQIAVYAKDVDLNLDQGLTKARVLGTVILQDKQPLRINNEGELLNQDVLDDRATAMAQIFLDRLLTTTCQWPVNRVYKGFISGQGAIGLPGVMFDLVSWFDTGTGPMTAFLRQGIAGTGELYQTSTLPAEGLIEDDFDATAIYENNVVQRVGGLIPSQSRAMQNEGWWNNPKNELIRLVGSGLGPYMMRTQSLRYGEYAQVSTGGRGDLRGRLYRPWFENQGDTQGGSGVGKTGSVDIVWIYDVAGATANAWVGWAMDQTGIDRDAWTTREAVYIAGMNHESLENTRMYLARRGSENLTDIYGTLPTYATYCCEGGDTRPDPPPPPEPPDNPIPDPPCVPRPFIYREIGFTGIRDGQLIQLRATLSSIGSCEDPGVPGTFNASCGVTSITLNPAGSRYWDNDPPIETGGCFWSGSAGGGVLGETCTLRGYGMALYWYPDGTWAVRKLKPDAAFGFEYGGPPSISGIVPVSVSPLHLNFQYASNDVACGGPQFINVDITEVP